MREATTNEAFDFIAMPKGQWPGGAVQASTGEWFFVLPANLDLSDVIELLAKYRAGRPVTGLERDAAKAALDSQDASEQPD